MKGERNNDEDSGYNSESSSSAKKEYPYSNESVDEGISEGIISKVQTCPPLRVNISQQLTGNKGRINLNTKLDDFKCRCENCTIDPSGSLCIQFPNNISPLLTLQKQTLVEFPYKTSDETQKICNTVIFLNKQSAKPLNLPRHFQEDGSLQQSAQQIISNQGNHLRIQGIYLQNETIQSNKQRQKYLQMCNKEVLKIGKDIHVDLRKQNDTNIDIQNAELPQFLKLKKQQPQNFDKINKQQSFSPVDTHLSPLNNLNQIQQSKKEEKIFQNSDANERSIKIGEGPDRLGLSVTNTNNKQIQNTQNSQFCNLKKENLDLQSYNDVSSGLNSDNIDTIRKKYYYVDYSTLTGEKKLFQQGSDSFTVKNQPDSHSRTTPPPKPTQNLRINSNMPKYRALIFDQSRCQSLQFRDIIEIICYQCDCFHLYRQTYFSFSIISIRVLEILQIAQKQVIDKLKDKSENISTSELCKAFKFVMNRLVFSALFQIISSQKMLKYENLNENKDFKNIWHILNPFNDHSSSLRFYMIRNFLISNQDLLNVKKTDTEYFLLKMNKIFLKLWLISICNFQGGRIWIRINRNYSSRQSFADLKAENQYENKLQQPPFVTIENTKEPQKLSLQRQQKQNIQFQPQYQRSNNMRHISFGYQMKNESLQRVNNSSQANKNYSNKSVIIRKPKSSQRKKDTLQCKDGNQVKQNVFNIEPISSELLDTLQSKSINNKKDSSLKGVDLLSLYPSPSRNSPMNQQSKNGFNVSNSQKKGRLLRKNQKEEGNKRSSKSIMPNIKDKVFIQEKQSSLQLHADGIIEHNLDSQILTLEKNEKQFTIQLLNADSRHEISHFERQSPPKSPFRKKLSITQPNIFRQQKQNNNTPKGNISKFLPTIQIDDMDQLSLKRDKSCPDPISPSLNEIPREYSSQYLDYDQTSKRKKDNDEDIFYGIQINSKVMFQQNGAIFKQAKVSGKIRPRFESDLNAIIPKNNESKILQITNPPKLQDHKSKNGSQVYKIEHHQGFVSSSHSSKSVGGVLSSNPYKMSGKVIPYPQLFLQNKQRAQDYYTEIMESLNLSEHLMRQQPIIELMKFSLKKQTIVFDLDETLIKAADDPSKIYGGQYDVRSRLDIKKLINKNLYISFRPYLFEMLKALKKNFELLIFTAGFDIYAETIIKEIQREERFFDYVITREFCTPHPAGKNQVKDLIQLLDSRNIKDIIIVDNRATSFAIHFTNGIPIKDYEGDKSDRYLVSLNQYLLSFQSEKDVRNKIRQDFKLDELVNQRTKYRNRIKSGLQSFCQSIKH